MASRRDLRLVRTLGGMHDGQLQGRLRTRLPAVLEVSRKGRQGPQPAGIETAREDGRPTGFLGPAHQ